MNANHLNSLSGFSPEYIARLRERFDAKWVRDPETGCHVWRAALNGVGYGNIGVGGHNRVAHRIAWLLARGDIPEGFVLDHGCRTPSCVNPAHLEVVTNYENRRRGLLGDLRLTCKHGHDFRAPRGLNAAGRCRLCVNATMRKYKSKRRLAEAEVRP